MNCGIFSMFSEILLLFWFAVPERLTVNLVVGRLYQFTPFEFDVIELTVTIELKYELPPNCDLSTNPT